MPIFAAAFTGVYEVYKVVLTGRERQEVERRYNSTISLTSALDGSGWR
jgi:hypothetical protein